MATGSGGAATCATEGASRWKALPWGRVASVMPDGAVDSGGSAAAAAPANTDAAPAWGAGVALPEGSGGVVASLAVSSFLAASTMPMSCREGLRGAAEGVVGGRA